MTHRNHQRILKALRENPGPLIEWAAENIIRLGARFEWSMEDNFTVTEGLAALASREYGLPSASKQGPAGLAFYGRAAEDLGLAHEMEELLHTWRNEAMDGSTILGFGAWLDRQEEEDG